MRYRNALALEVVIAAAWGAAPSATFVAPHVPFAASPSRDARSSAPSMLLELRSSVPFGLWGGSSNRPEVLYEDGVPVDFHMETLHMTKRRVSGGILVPASPEALWQVLTAYERMPETIPNILSNIVTRDGTSIFIEQESLLSNRMNLRTSIRLEAIEERERWMLRLRRLSGHGFLEFEAEYKLRPRPDGTTYLSYEVELIPCPIFPLPLVERKIRKEVPKMLSALARVARTEGVK